jgi:ferredoxin--NADP+ reductase
VALDVARMLAFTGNELATTDVVDHALQAFSASSVREIVALGRRGAPRGCVHQSRTARTGSAARGGSCR